MHLPLPEEYTNMDYTNVSLKIVHWVILKETPCGVSFCIYIKKKIEENIKNIICACIFITPSSFHLMYTTPNTVYKLN